MIVGGAGNDAIDGGSGIDTADFTNATGAVTVDLAAGTADEAAPSRVGPPSFSTSTLDGTAGFRILGELDGDHAGVSVSAAGDVNGDGIADVIIGAHSNDAGGSSAGAAYVVFGTTAAVTSVDLTAIAAGTGGFKIIGEAGSVAGRSVGGGDINGDGFADLLVGARSAGTYPNVTGAAYVVFGSAAPGRLRRRHHNEPRRGLPDYRRGP